jgi:hypothetical protein
MTFRKVRILVSKPLLFLIQIPDLALGRPGHVIFRTGSGKI